MAQIFIPGTASPADVLSGRLFSAGKNYISSGTMPNRGAPTWTPGASAQSLSSGFYSGGTISAVSNLIAGNIKYGANVGGVAGSFKSVNAHGITVLSGTTGYFTNGNDAYASYYYVSISGLTFRPYIIFLNCNVFTPSGNYNVITIYQDVWGGGMYHWGYGRINKIDTMAFYFVQDTNSTAPISPAMLSMTGDGGGRNIGYVNSSGFCLPVAYTNSTYAPGSSVNWYAYGELF